jgi:hypothetical protein
MCEIKKLQKMNESEFHELKMTILIELRNMG